MIITKFVINSRHTVLTLYYCVSTVTNLKVTDNHSSLSWCCEVKDSEETELTGITRMLKCLINSQSTFTRIVLPDPHNRAVREVEQLLLTSVSEEDVDLEDLSDLLT